MTLATELVLNCFLGGAELFDINIAKHSSVNKLKQSIKETLSPLLNDVPAPFLTLWKVSIPADDVSALTAFVPQNDAAKGVFLLKPLVHLEQVFATQPVEDHVHIVVQRPPQPSGINDQTSGGDAERGDIVTELTKRFENMVTKMITCDPPSKSSKSGGYRTFQLSNPLYDGRYVVSAKTPDTRAPPVQLYNPIFARFLDDIANNNLEVPDLVLQATARLMDRSSAIYDSEDLRRRAIGADLTDAISTAMAQVVNLDKSAADGTVATKTPVDTGYQLAAISIREDKNEIGDGGSDPSTQACLSYGRFWAQPDHARVQKQTCCPTFLLAIAGPWFAILGAVWTDKIVVQRLTDYVWIGNDTVLNEPSIYRVARILHALGTNMHRLEAYYQSLKVQPLIPNKLHPRFFPSINTYRADENTLIEFKFIEPLEHESICTTFLAETQGPSPMPIVVKFVYRYNKEAHTLLANSNMAPNLLYFGKVGVCDGDPSYGHLQMVVMDYVEGTTVDRAPILPSSFREQVQAMLELLHDNDYVFGDLRGPNLMLKKDKKTLVLIDCDWIGKHGESRYPIAMSQTIEWPEGVKNGLGVMKKEHDMEMLERLVQGLTFER